MFNIVLSDSERKFILIFFFKYFIIFFSSIYAKRVLYAPVSSIKSGRQVDLLRLFRRQRVFAPRTSLGIRGEAESRRASLCEKAGNKCRRERRLSEAIRGRPRLNPRQSTLPCCMS